MRPILKRAVLCGNFAAALRTMGQMGQMGHQQEPIRKTAGSEIPDKLYFRIGEVSRLCEVPAYVLRFWEGEFPQLKPNKGGTGQRLYRRRDVEMALRIKSLLYDQGYTIPGARQVFKSEQKLAVPELQLGLEPVASREDAARLAKLRGELKDLHALLSKPVKHASESMKGSRNLRPVAVAKRDDGGDEKLV